MELDPNEIQKKILELTPDKQKEVIDFIEFLTSKNKSKEKKFLKLDWAGGLKDLRDKYTSVELQHKISEWRGC